MTKEKEILQVNVRKDANTASRTYGMYFGEVEYKGLLSTRALAEHIASHGSVWTRDIVEGILKQLQICIPEKVCQGEGCLNRCCDRTCISTSPPWEGLGEAFFSHSATHSET